MIITYNKCVGNSKATHFVDFMSKPDNNATCTMLQKNNIAHFRRRINII